MVTVPGSTLALTGVSGALGGQVARLLAAEGHALRLLCRDPSRAPALPRAQALSCDFTDPVGAVAALRGVDTLFMVSMTERQDRAAVQRRFVEAAAEAGVRHVVYTSFVGAGDQASFLLARDHGDTEAAVRATGMAWTFLRDNLYLEALVGFAGPDGAIRGPAGSGRVAGVARGDVARCVAAVLQDPRRHAGRAYELTGPEALTLTELAATVSEVTGRACRFVDETHEQAYASRAVYAAPAWQVDAWISTYTAIAAGELSTVSPDVAALTGRPATTLAALLRRAARRDTEASGI